jgi:hypothetical protein
VWPIGNDVDPGELHRTILSDRPNDDGTRDCVVLRSRLNEGVDCMVGLRRP